MRTGNFLLLAVLIGAGCGVNLHPDIPRQAGVPARGDVVASKAARGVPDTIGHGTFTLFAIPVAPVHITNGAGDQLVMQSVKDALGAAGYHVVDPGSDHARALECRVTRFSFKNYTWLTPLVITWGGIDLELQMVDANGQAVWQRAYTGHSTNFSYSFERAVNASMQQILEKAVTDFQDSAFQDACCAAPPPTPTAAAAPGSQVETLSDRLQNLGDLRRHSLISEQEYGERRKAILDDTLKSDPK